MRHLAAVFAGAVLLVACAGPVPDDLIAVPTQSPGPFLGIETGCPGALLEGTLVANDEVGFVVVHADGFVSPVIWPHGYVARSVEPRELLDASGAVVAREGDHFSGGGGWLGPTDAAGFTVCGEFEIVPAD